MNIAKLFIPLSIILVLMALTSCNEEPTELGIVLVSDTVDVVPISSDDVDFITACRVYTEPHHNIHKDATTVGVYDMGEGPIKSVALLRFSVNHEQFAEVMDLDSIINVELVMKPRTYVIGDTNNNNFGFKLYKVDEYWDNKSYYDYFFPSDDMYSSPMIDYTKSYGEYNSEIAIRDTNRIIIPIDKEIIKYWSDRAWEEANRYGEDSVNILTNNWGLAMVPDPGTNVIKQFEGVNLAADEDADTLSSRLVVYRNRIDTTDTGHDTTVIDTLVFKVALENSIASGPQHDNDDDIVTQGLLAQYTELEFNLNAIPKGSAIQFAQLTLHVDNSKSYFGTDQRDTALYGMVYLDNDVHSGNLFDMSYGVWETNNHNVYNFTNFPFLIERWLEYEDGIGYVHIRQYDFEKHYLTPDKLVFHGPNDPDPALRPKLKIIYTTRPNYKDLNND